MFIPHDGAGDDDICGAGGRRQGAGGDQHGRAGERGGSTPRGPGPRVTVMRNVPSTNPRAAITAARA